MKKPFLLFTAICALLYISLTSYSDGAAQHGLNCTGSDGGTPSCAGSSCHGSNDPSTTVDIKVCLYNTTTQITEYTPESDYTVYVTGTNSSSLDGFGFQVSAVSSGNVQAGSFTVNSATTQQTTMVNFRQLIENKQTLGGSGYYSTMFTWRAPVAGKGTVKFYTMLCAVNGDGKATGDAANAAGILSIKEYGSSSVSTINNSPIITTYPNPVINELHINLSAYTKGDYYLSIYSSNGKLLINQSINTNNQPELTFSTSSWAPGIYYVETRGDNGINTSKIIKQ